jgi:hypothetical protein
VSEQGEREIREWDDSQEYRIEECDLWDHLNIVHNGLRVKVPRLEAFREVGIWRYFPKFAVSSEDEQRKMLAKALWTRLQRHYGEPVGSDRVS